LHEFEKKELTGLLKKYFKNIEDYYQATWKYVAIQKIDAIEGHTKMIQETLNLAPLKEKQCLYFYFICSNRNITEKIQPIAAVGEHYSDRTVMAEDVKQYNLVTNLNTKIERLNSDLLTARSAQVELKAIKGSKSYKLAQRLARIKKMVR
jgi:hypothetical protein